MAWCRGALVRVPGALVCRAPTDERGTMVPYWLQTGIAAASDARGASEFGGRFLSCKPPGRSVLTMDAADPVRVESSGQTLGILMVLPRCPSPGEV